MISGEVQSKIPVIRSKPAGHHHPFPDDSFLCPKLVPSCFYSFHGLVHTILNNKSIPGTSQINLVSQVSNEIGICLNQLIICNISRIKLLNNKASKIPQEGAGCVLKYFITAESGLVAEHCSFELILGVPHAIFLSIMLFYC